MVRLLLAWRSASPLPLAWRCGLGDFLGDPPTDPLAHSPPLANGTIVKRERSGPFVLTASANP